MLSAPPFKTIQQEGRRIGMGDFPAPLILSPLPQACPRASLLFLSSPVVQAVVSFLCNQPGQSRQVQPEYWSPCFTLLNLELHSIFLLQLLCLLMGIGWRGVPCLAIPGREIWLTHQRWSPLLESMKAQKPRSLTGLWWETLELCRSCQSHNFVCFHLRVVAKKVEDYSFKVSQHLLLPPHHLS